MLLTKKDPNRPRAPAWFKGLLLLFVLYAFATQCSKKDAEQPLQVVEDAKRALKAVVPSHDVTALPEAPKHTEIGEKDSSKVMSETVAHILPALRTEDVKKGSGTEATCGRTVAVRYDAFLSDGTKIDSNRDAAQPLSFVIGSHKVMPALEEGVQNMNAGGTRNLFSPAYMAYRGAFANAKIPQNSPVSFILELISVEPAIPEAALQMRTFMVSAGNGGEQARCGSQITVALVIWNPDGTTAFQSSKPNAEPQFFTFTIGAGEVPLGIEEGVLNMRPGELRSLVIPPPYLKPIGAYAKSATPIPANQPLAKLPIRASQTAMIDVFRVVPEMLKKPAAPAAKAAK